MRAPKPWARRSRRRPGERPRRDAPKPARQRRQGAVPTTGADALSAPQRPAGPLARAPLLLLGYFFLSPSESEDSTAMKASCGTSTLPTIFIRFLPSFCFSSSFRLREMSPP